MLKAAVVLGMLASLLISHAVAAEREEWLPTSSAWVGKGHGQDAKGVKVDRGGFTLLVNSRDGDRFTGTLATTSEGRAAGAKVEVEGTVSSTHRVHLKVTKVVQGQPPDGFLEAKFTGRIVDEGRRLDLRADHPSGGFIAIELTRDEGAKAESKK